MDKGGEGLNLSSPPEWPQWDTQWLRTSPPTHARPRTQCSMNMPHQASSAMHSIAARRAGRRTERCTASPHSTQTSGQAEAKHRFAGVPACLAKHGFAQQHAGKQAGERERAHKRSDHIIKPSQRAQAGTTGHAQSAAHSIDFDQLGLAGASVDQLGIRHCAASTGTLGLRRGGEIRPII